jgi:hypothetical protein
MRVPIGTQETMKYKIFVNTHHTDEKFKRIWIQIPQRKRLFKADRVGGEHAKVTHRKTEF